MDVQMPEMDGFEATAAIRLREAVTGTHIPIVAMTAHAMKGDRERCLAVGMDAYISKPIQAEELLKMVEILAADSGPIDTTNAARPIMDRHKALARMDGDEALLNDLAKLFLEESPRMLEAIAQAVAEKDAERLQRAAHSLKGSVATFSAQDALAAALKLERLGRSGDLEEAERAYAALANEIERLRSALEALSARQERVPTVESL
jgi:CheY-like chemotaxis protein